MTTPSMDDIAKLVGVAKSTVSLALHDRPGVSPELKARILKAAEELGYRLDQRPSRRANELKSFAVINHVVQESESEISGVALGCLDGIQSYARETNIHLTVLTDYRTGEGQRLGLEFLEQASMAPDGLILTGAAVTRDSPFIAWAERRGIPLVVLSRNWPDLPISTVSQDHRQQARIALDHLIELGHRRIAFVARHVDRQCDWFPWRLECYREALARIGEPFDPELVVTGVDGGAAAKSLMAAHPEVTAIFAIYDRVAVEAMQGLAEIGYRVPHDVSIIGLDNAAQPPDGYPRLTTVGFSHFQAGYLAAELLAKKLQNPEMSYANIVLRSYLIVRDSCAAPRPG